MAELFHRKIERTAIGFVLAIIAAASVGGIVEIVPLFTIDETVEDVPDMRLYTPLELAGRDIYVREGCYACHSQMVRTLVDEVDRYGPYSLAVESQYDHPMQWGSKRTGPDLARVGGKYSDIWHVAHLINPRQVTPESNMPAYPWLMETELDVYELAGRLNAQRMVGVPYTQEMVENAATDAIAQADPESSFGTGLAARYGEETQVSLFDGVTGTVTEMDALVAYLQILGLLTNAAYEQSPDMQEAPDVAGEDASQLISPSVEE
ncbi:cytochrome-c oxidase, cbb3-type subunit II [Pelagibacterium flavum]|uniref:Cytochrome-c oxidase, cbb3-type subunit II n=1 Tax=Pelagibacterium flavum TaxID=2984530 RepID=A0ABY6IPU0_9HYPH|nr:cytochrome-c oxidase, cbb3-type subunit II [Pelagibacterium sp. YIM 151497]UYQ71159.1 cytochrome-c oxidase, cbb3-type subunit II [Pelagibacterium sp. YIM 151497]UYQ72631.1 cytochrome-c oxidase, cbb3-type subunit II [Pelagibacterium sp. YIM 151497]